MGLGSGNYYVIEAVSSSSYVFAQNTEFVLQIQAVQVGKKCEFAFSIFSIFWISCKTVLLSNTARLLVLYYNLKTVETFQITKFHVTYLNC